MNGDIDRFGMDKLVNLLGKIGMEVTVIPTSKIAYDRPNEPYRLI